MKVNLKLFIFSILALLLIFSQASIADIYEIPENVSAPNPDIILTKKLATAAGITESESYKVKPIDSGYTYQTPSPEMIKSNIISKQFVTTSTTIHLESL